MSNPQDTNSALKIQITEDKKSSMKSGDKKRLAAIKLILAAVLNQEVDTRKVLTDQDIFAILKKLPILFFCENNKYSVYSNLEQRQPKNRKLYELARSFGNLCTNGLHPADHSLFRNKTVEQITHRDPMATFPNGPRSDQSF